MVIDFSQMLSQYGWLVLLVVVAAVARGDFLREEARRAEANGIVYA